MPSKYTIGHNASIGHLGVHVGGDFRDQCGRDLDVVQLTHDLLNVASGHPLGIQREDLFVETWQASLVLADQLRLERTVAIAGRGDGRGVSHQLSLSR
jgi:hypothetical protein